MKSMNRKKLVSQQERENRQLTKSEKRKLLMAGVAAALILIIVLVAGAGYAIRQAAAGGGLSLQAVENSMKEQMREQLEAASAYLEGLNESISGNQEKLGEVSAQLKERQESLLEVETTQKKLTENASEVSTRVEKLQQHTQTEIDSLEAELSSIQQEIARTMEELVKVLEALEDQRLENGKMQESEKSWTLAEFTRINEAVQKINHSVTDVENHLNLSWEKLKGLLKELEESREEGQGEMVSHLTEVEKNLRALLEGDMVEITASFQNMAQGFSAQVDQLKQLLDGLNTAVNGLEKGVGNHFLALNQNLAKQFAALDVSSGQDNAALMEQLEQLRASLEEDLNQVFTSVSDGKQGLASALLTKGVEIEETASFSQIRDAILRIKQELLIGVEQIPGTISYQYHYHVDGKGQNPHAETSAVSGGCFTNAKYHVHQERDGCYVVDWYHEHTDDCPGYPIKVDWTEHEDYWGYIYECGDQPLNASSRKLVCNKSTSTVEAYLPSCGLVDGQIVGATIVYEQERAASLLAEQISAQEQAVRDEMRAEENRTNAEEGSALPEAPERPAESVGEEESKESEGSEETAETTGAEESAEAAGTEETAESAETEESTEVATESAATEESAEIAGSEGPSETAGAEETGETEAYAAPENQEETAASTTLENPEEPAETDNAATSPEA